MVLSSRTKTSICNMALDILHEGALTDVDTDDTSVSRWFLRNYQELLDAELRDNVWKFAVKRRRLYPRDYILRGKSGSINGTLTGAWGLVRLIESWTGDLITLRRSSDSTSESFGVLLDETGLELVDEDGGLLLDESGISTFLGSSTGYVSQLFDQSGNARHLVQATTTKQPVYEDEETVSGRASASFDGTDDLLATSGNMSNLITTTVGWLVIAGRIDELALDSATATADHLLLGDQGQKVGLYARTGGNLYGYNDDGSGDTITDAVPLLQPFVATLRHATTTLYTSVNGSDELSATSGTTSSLASVFQIGDIAGSNALNGHVFVALAYSVPPDEGERRRIVERLMRYVKAGGAGNDAWSHRYPIPSDCLKMLAPRSNGTFEGNQIPYEVEGEYILTARGAYVDARYVAAITDPTRFDVLFVKALAGAMAEKMAHWLTGKTTMVEIAAAFRNRALSDAKRSNAIEGTAERPYDNDVIDARYRA